MLHAVLNGHEGALNKPGLKEVVAEHGDWLGGSRFLMVPYHLVGSTDLDSALLGGYVHTVRELHPDKPTPAVYRADALLADADRQRTFLGDDDKFRQWLGAGAQTTAAGGGDPADPVFHLHLSDLDVEPLLEEVQGVADQDGYRRQWIKDQLWAALGIPDAQAFVCERTVVWRGTKRTVEFVFGNVRDPHLPDAEFTPQTEGNIRFVFDYPFDDHGRSPMDDVQRVERMKRAGRTAPTIVWLPHFLSERKARNLGRLLKINYLLERDRLDDHTATRPAEERV